MVMVLRAVSALAALFFTIIPVSYTADVFFSVDADPFLGRFVATRPYIHASIESVLQDTCDLKQHTVESHLARMEEELRPTFKTLPLNRYGRVGSTAVRYLLHRHFLHYRAWLVKGLAPDGEAWNASFPMQILQSGAPEEVRAIVAGHLKGRGLTLREAAVIATMLENQVHADAVEKLELVWSALGLRPSENITRAKMQEVVEAHACIYVLPDKFPNNSINHDNIQDAQLHVQDTLPGWPQTQKFLAQTLQTDVPDDSAALGIDVAKRVVTEVVERYGRWQDAECREIKHALVSIESSRPGRVELVKFYDEAISGRHWGFSDSVPYLRQLGALDESDPLKPSVIIPNYINGPANYVIASPHFAVSCTDECEELLGRIEKDVGAPMASVEQIAEVVCDLASSSQGPLCPASDRRNHGSVMQAAPVSALPTPLLRRLEEVAAVHGGHVPLHGRLFALWLHHAYPRDCPYPHPAGTTKPMLGEEFQDIMKIPAQETRINMIVLRLNMTLGAIHDKMSPAPLPWDLNEELLQAPRKPDSLSPEQMREAAVVASFGALITCLAFVLWLYPRISKRGRDVVLESGVVDVHTVPPRLLQ